MPAINVRVTDEELAAIKERASQAGLPMADLVKSLATVVPKDRGQSIINALERIEDVMNQILDYLPTLATQRGITDIFSDGVPIPPEPVRFNGIAGSVVSAVGGGYVTVPAQSTQDYDAVDPP